MQNRPVAWANNLPLPLRGGPASETQKRLREGRYQRPMPPDASPGAAVRPLSYSELKPRKSYMEGGNVVGNVGKWDEPQGGSTGSKMENIIQADRPVNIKQFKDHEGEYYASAPLTQILDGPEGVEKILMDAARKKIASKRISDKNKPAIVNQADLRIAKPAGTEPAAAPLSMEKRVMVGFGPGGSTTISDQLNDYFNDPANAGKTDVSSSDVETWKASQTQTPANNTELPSALQSSSNTASFAPPPPPKTYTEKDYWKAQDAGFDSIPEYEAAQKAAADTAASFTAPHPVEAPEAPSAPVIEDPTKTIPQATLSQQLGRDLTPQEKSFADTANDLQKANFLLNAGAITKAEADAMKAKYFDENPEAAAEVDKGVDPEIKRMLDKLKGYADGTDPALEATINRTLDRYGSDTAAGREALLMQLAGQGITGPAAQAILASYDRNAKIGANQLRGNFATQVLQSAKTDAANYLGALRNERTYSDSQKSEAMTIALASNDYDTYGRLYKDLYGYDIDIDILKDDKKVKELNTAKDDIIAVLARDGSATIDDNVDGKLLRDAAEIIWKANGNTGEMTNEDANGIIDTLRNTTSQIGMVRNALSPEDAAAMFFNGKMTGENSLAEFKIPGHAKGYASFQQQMVNMFTNQYVKFNDNGQLDFDFKNVLKIFPEAKIQFTTEFDVPEPEEGYQIGDIITANNGVDYKISKANEDGTYSITSGSEEYVAERDPEGGWTITPAAIIEGFNVKDDSSLEIDGEQVTIMLNGERVPVYEVGDGYNTEPDGTGATVQIDKTKDSETAASFKGWNYNKDGQLINADGDIQLDESQQPLKKAVFNGYTYEEYAINSKGEFYKLGELGEQTIKIGDMSAKEMADNWDSWEVKVREDWMKQNANREDDVNTFAMYMDSIGTKDPNYKIIEGFYRAGSPEAKTWLNNLTKPGTSENQTENKKRLSEIAKALKTLPATSAMYKELLAGAKTFPGGKDIESLAPTSGDIPIGTFLWKDKNGDYRIVTKFKAYGYWYVKYYDLTGALINWSRKQNNEEQEDSDKWNNHGHTTTLYNEVNSLEEMQKYQEGL